MIELRDAIAFGSLFVAVVSMLIVSRNARRATAVNAQNLDLARIRDLRIELKETKDELDGVKRQARELNAHLAEANDRAISYARREAEMLRFARMPGVTIDDWLRRFDPDDSHEIAVR
jgi:hypothetical protein